MSYIEYVTSDPGAENPLEEMARANGFSIADLDQNRAGKISDSQWFRLLARALEPVRHTGGALLGWLLCCFVVKMLVPRIVLWILAMLGTKGLGVLIGGVTLGCVGAFLLSLFKSANTIALLLVDLKDGKSACLEGRVSATKEEEGGLGMARIHGEKHTKYFYVAKNEHFAVDEAAYSALPQGGQFRLYHTPRSKLLLSIEPR